MPPEPEGGSFVGAAYEHVLGASNDPAPAVLAVFLRACFAHFLSVEALVPLTLREVINIDRHIGPESATLRSPPRGPRDENAIALPPSLEKEPGMQRRHLRQTVSLEERLAEQARLLRQRAESLPPGIEREQAIRKARQAETGAQIREWLSSPGLLAPK